MVPVRHMESGRFSTISNIDSRSCARARRRLLGINLTPTPEPSGPHGSGSRRIPLCFGSEQRRRSAGSAPTQRPSTQGAMAGLPSAHNLQGPRPQGAERRSAPWRCSAS